MAHLLRNSVRRAPPRAFLGDSRECIMRSGIARAGLVRIFGVLQFLERETAAVEKDIGLPDGVGIFAEQARHLGRRLQMPLGIGFQEAAGRIDGQVLADAGDDVLQRPRFGGVIEHVVDGDERCPSNASTAVASMRGGGMTMRLRPAMKSATSAT